MNHLREIFEQRADGLSMEEFISVMSKALPNTSTTGSRLDEATVHSLRELFLQVDVNGDGTMEWDEFTGFCIDQGIAATVSHSSHIPDQLYVEQTKYVDKTRAFDSLVERIDWIPELEKIFVSESNCSSLKVYDPDRGKRGPKFLHAIQLDQSKSEHRHETKGAHKDKIKLAPAKGAQAKKTVHPTCVQYIPALGMIAVAMSDIALSFWDTGVYRRDPDNGIPWFVKRVYTEKLVLKMTWCAPVQTLFTCGGLASGNIIAWKVTMGEQFKCQKVATLKGHTDVCTDLLSVVKMRGTHVDFCGLVSSSLDRKIIIWDTETYAIKGKRVGHKMGVRSLGLVTGKNDGCLVLSSGFDAEVLLWEVGGLANKPLMRLGHTAPVVQARMQSDGRIVTVDNFGTIKWWHVGSSFSDNNSAECIQTVLAFTGMGTTVPVPTTMVVAGVNKRLLVGTKNMRVFDLVRVRPRSQPAVGLLYNKSSMTVAAAQARNVRVWNATTGQLESNFHDCCDHKVSHDADISALCLDKRHRKFVTADLAGSVSVFNFMNGALMKRNSLLHRKEISAMVYCDTDQCIITGSWDRSWKVLDENAGAKLPVLRTVHMAHEFDISAVAHSHVLNLVATGDSNGVVKIWDFQFATHEGTCCELDLQGKGIEITCLTFLDPYPLLAVADFAGGVYLYTVRPWYSPYRLIRKFDNTITDHFGQTTKWPVTAMQYKYDSNGGEEISEGITTGQCLLCVGDENGNIGVYDCMPIVTAAGITAISKKDMPTERNNYNARRRAMMYGQGFNSLEGYENNKKKKDRVKLEESRGDVSSRFSDSDSDDTARNRTRRGRIPSQADSDVSDSSRASSLASTGSSVLESSGSVPALPAIHASKRTRPKRSNRKKTQAGNGKSKKNKRHGGPKTRTSSSALSMGLGSAGGASMMAARKTRGAKRGTGVDVAGAHGAVVSSTTMSTSPPKLRRSSTQSAAALYHGPTAIPRPALVAQWLAHEGQTVTAIDVNIDDGNTNAIPFILSSGEDLCLRAFALNGRPLGYLTKGDELDKARRTPYPWTCLVDVGAQAEEDHRLTTETRESVIVAEKAEQKAFAKAELNRKRAEANKALAKSRPSSPKAPVGSVLVGEDVEWCIGKGLGWEECDGRLKSALESAYQDDVVRKKELKRKADEKLAAIAAEQAKQQASGKKKKKKKQKEVWTDSEEEEAEEVDDQGVPEPGIMINVRGNSFMFDPDHQSPTLNQGKPCMTLKALDKANAEYQTLKRKDGNAALDEKKKMQENKDKDRGRVVGQLMGQKTWVLTDLERGRMMAEEEEKEKKRMIKLAAKKKQSAQEKKDADMQELLADPPSPKDALNNDEGGNVKLPVDHPGNWAMGSHNRLKMLYPKFHSEQHRTQVKEEQRHQQLSPGGSPVNSGDEGDGGSEAKWLESRLRLHGGLVQQLDLKKARQDAQVQGAHERLAALQKEQRDSATAKKRWHEEKLKNDVDYRLNYEAAKKPAVPGHKVKKMTYSNSAPKLDTDISKEARRIRRKLAASGVMPEKITSPDKIRERLKYVLRDLDRDVQSALDQAKHKRKKGAPLSKTGTEDDMTLEEKADQEKMEAEERMLKEKRRSERRAALKNKLHFGTYTKEHIMHMREKFKDMDQDESGSIDLDEFLEAQNASHISDHMASMFHAMDIDGDGNVSLREMCSVVFHKAPPRELKDIVAFLSMKKTPRLEVEVINPITQEEVEELRQIFDLYDEDGGGFLDRMEIYKALGVVSGYSAQTGLSLKELDDMIDEADVDGGGTIDKEEFVNMMSQVTHGVATFDPW